VATLPTPPNQNSASNNNGARKRKIRLDDNGEPVIYAKKKVLGPRPQKNSTRKKVVPTSKKASTSMKPVAAGPSQKRAASVEEVDDEDDEDLNPSLANAVGVPRNPRNILESVDGSDDNIYFPTNLNPGSAMDVDDTNPADDVIEIPDDEVDGVEIEEEDDEAELGMFSIN
jgi:hypothetical protein